MYVDRKLEDAHSQEMQTEWQTSPPSAPHQKNPSHATRTTYHSQHAPASWSLEELQTRNQRKKA